MSQARTRARRLRRPLLLLGLVACLGGGAAWLLWPADTIDLRTYQRVQLGMGRQDVEAMLRRFSTECHPDYYVSLPVDARGVTSEEAFAQKKRHKTWFGERYVISVVFDNDAGESVIGVYLDELDAYPGTQKQRGFLDRLRARLGL